MIITYQDLLASSGSENEKMNFVRNSIYQHKSSDAYKLAQDAEQYAKHKNVTICNFQKLLYTVSGNAVPDNWSPNFKMASNFFHRFISQENQYLLGNGVSWNNSATEKKLGTDKYPFDTQLQEAGKLALIMGESFGFFNLDHMEVFSFLEFVPIYDEENGSLCAGIRFWQIDDSKPLRATLYELDGYTEYIWESGKEARIIREKTPYKLKVMVSEADGVEIYDAENYPTFPIVPLWANTYRQSEFVGLREQIDCYDLIKSGFANTVDEASIVYWTLTNAGGMDDIDLAQFVQRLKTVHATTLEDQAQAQSHAIDPPVDGRKELLDRLETDLYKDAMALDTEKIAGGSVTATQIKAAYEPLNSKTDDYEYCVNKFIKGILAIAGIEDEPTFTRSVIINKNEEIQVVLQSAQYLDSDYVTEKILTILGDGDKVEDILERMKEEDMERMPFESAEETSEEE